MGMSVLSECLYMQFVCLQDANGKVSPQNAR